MAGEAWTAQSPAIKGRRRRCAARRGLGGTSAMRDESVGITWGEVMTAVLTLGIVTFLWLM
jgi:hypothetical protein